MSGQAPRGPSGEGGGGRRAAGPKAAVVAIGDELIAGRYPDRNSGEVAGQLARLGIEVRRFVVLPDDEGAIAGAFADLCAGHDVVLSTGGLGPTLDDLTREAAARAAGCGLELDRGVRDWLERWFESRGRRMAPANERQARFPAGARVLPNRCGTAPGFALGIGTGRLFCLPGPPTEMRDMLALEVLPELRDLPGAPVVREHEVHLVGLAESDFAERAGPWMQRGTAPRMGVTSHLGVLAVTLRAEAGTAAEAAAALERRRGELLERFAEHVYSEGPPGEAGSDLAHAVGGQLIARGVTLATAESCTGGLLAARLTDVPGISAVYSLGWVTYANGAKVRELGVPAELIERHGAVSREVALAMAQGARREGGAGIGVSLTGLAGPGGGTPEKPVGLVWCGLATEAGSSARELRLPPFGRAAVRSFAVHAALDEIRRALASSAGRGDLPGPLRWTVDPVDGGC